MWTTILSVFTGPFGKIISWVIGILAVAGVAGGVYFGVVHYAKQAQLQKDQIATLQQVIVNQQKFIEDTKALVEMQKKLEESLTKQLETIETNTKKLDEYLNSPDTAKIDRPSSDILKRTIEELGGTKQ